MTKPITKISQKTKANVPDLRFKEFVGQWARKKIKDISSVKSGSTPLRSNKLFFQDGNLPWVKTTDLNNYFIYETEESITDYALKNTSARLNPVNSVLVAMYGGFNQIGRTGFLKVEASTNQALSVLNPEESKVLPLYLLIWLNAKVSVWRKFAGSSRKDPNITGSDVKSFPIAFPSLPEQQKIATFLSAIDQKIQQLSRKKALLAQYKKGSMQQLFSRQLRFKDENGEDFPDWEEKRLGEVVTIKTPKYNPLKDEDNPKCIELEHLSQKTGELLGYLNGKDLKSLKSRFKKGDILFGKLRPYLRKFLLTTFSGVCSTEIWVLKGKEILNEFLFYLVQSEKFSEMADISSGSKMPRANWKVVSEGIFYLPALPEQQKIANFLSNIDNKITTVSKQITEAQTFKKGLLQQLFV